MNQTTRDLVTKAVQTALAQIGTEFNLEISYQYGTFGPNQFNGKITVSEIGTKDHQDSGYARLLGLPADIIGRTFKHKTKTFTITGLNPSAPKFCVCLQDQNGKGFKCSVAQLRELGGLKF